MSKARVGVIGGSGVYDIKGISNVQQVDLDTPFGKPSDIITIGELGGVNVAFLPRHGRGHRISPTELPARANIYALKSLGVEHIIAVNAVGSFRDELKPGDIIIPDQLIDRTRSRVNSFFEGGIVVHIQFAQPFCAILNQTLLRAAKDVGATTHFGGSCIVMEGPALSTQAESRLYRSWGASIIGMTALPEAKLAREAEICYSIIASITDYDSWHEAAKPLEIADILAILSKNADIIKDIIKLSVSRLPDTRECPCASALSTAIVTDPALVPDEVKKKYQLLIGKYISKKRT